MKTALTIAGSDPSAGAGIQADLRVFAAFGVYGLSAITSLTAQNRLRVTAALHTPSAFLKKQVAALLVEFEINAVKIGMMGTSGNVAAICRLLKGGRLGDAVLDPVIKSTKGFPLLDVAGIKALRKLIPLVKVVTPNLDEAAALAGLMVRDVHEMELAASIIHGQGAPYVLVKGGHLKGAAVDILYDGREYQYFEAARLKSRPQTLHGTGCILSAAVAAGLAKGATVEKAVRDAKAYLVKAIEGKGKCLV